MEATAGRSFSASPIVCNERVYVSDLSGKTYDFQASGEAYQKIAVNRLGDDCYASPAAVGGELFRRIGRGQGGARHEQLVCLAETRDASAPGDLQ